MIDRKLKQVVSMKNETYQYYLKNVDNKMQNKRYCNKLNQSINACEKEISCSITRYPPTITFENDMDYAEDKH